MKKMFLRAGMASALAAAAIAVPAATAAAASPADGTYCFAQSGGCSATWTADIPGSYAGVTSGSYSVTESTCTVVNGVDVTGSSPVASGGAGPFAGTPGSLAPATDGCGSPVTYTLTITGSGGGVIGNASGQPGAI
jgi:hypothetical protein